MPRPRPRSRLSRPSAQHPRRDTISSVRSSLYDAADRAYWALPRRIRRPVRAWLVRFAKVLEPEWRRTTLLVWVTRWGIMLAFTIFNVYLPKLLETRCLETFAKTSSLERSLWDVVILPSEGVRELWCISFLPIESGLFIDDENVTKLGAWLIERPGRGRRLSLAGSTLLTAMLCVGFVLAQNPIAVTASTVGISLSSSVRGLFLLACGSILSESTTGYVGCVIWVRHGLDCNRLTKAEILLCQYQAGRLKYLPRKVSLRRLRIFCLSCRAG